MVPMPTSPGDGDEDTTAAFREALAAFRERCSERSLQTFQHKSSLEVKCEIIRIQRDQERLRNMMNFRRVENFLVRMEEFSKILENIVDVELYLSYVWGPMQFLLQVASSTMLEGLDGLLDAYSRLGQKMPSLKNLQPIFNKDTGMLRCLSALYRDILEFHAGAYQCFTQFTERGRKKVFKSAWEDFSHRAAALEDNIEAHKTLVDHGRRTLQYGMPEETATSLSRSDGLALSAEVARYEAAGVSRARQAQILESQRHTEQFQSVLMWVSDPNASSVNSNASEETHSERSEVRRDYPNTCDWIRKIDAVDNWMNVGTPQHSILWINGSMGAGKSTLASYLIDECKENTSLGAPYKTIYFYCKARDPVASTYFVIFRGLLHQLLLQIQDKAKFWHLVSYCYDKKEQPHLNNEGMAKSLIDLFFDVIPYQYIIIDGLDECDKPEIKQCLSLLTSVVSRQDSTEPGRLRLLIVSRDIQEIKKPLSAEGATASIVKIQPQDNEEAISRYVTQRAGTFSSRFRLSDNEKGKIRDLTCNQAKGARVLVLNHLEQSITKDELLGKLNNKKFPKDLTQAYNQIVESIRKHQTDEQWAKTKSIFGWLICAGRILRWHEIQAIVSIERHEQSVEFERKRFIPHVQELCGTLVHVKPGNKVELIHHTAHEYIIASQFVSEVEVQFDLATLCMQYLTFPCFEKNMDKPTRRRFAKNGFYAFQDYAVSKWFYHLGNVVKISGQLFTVDAAKTRKFAEILDDFINRYQDSIDDHASVTEEPSSSSQSSVRSVVNMKEVEDNARRECEQLKDTLFYELLLNLWIHISKSEKESIEDRNKPSLAEMEKTLKDNRATIEELVGEARDEEANTELREYYGKHVFKCPRTRCDWFYEGFENKKKRDYHIDRHDRPFECLVAGCNIGGAGFISNKDLERHKKNYHATGGAADEPAAFPQPNKKKNHDARFNCTICGQRFTRKINLTGHTRSHFGERPYGCQNCGKKFTRVNDLRRHERLHLRK